MSSNVEDTFKVIETAPIVPRLKQIEISLHLKERIIIIKVRALTIKVGEHPVIIVVTLN